MTNSPWRYYFAYGSNMDGSQMGERCADAEFVGVAKLPGHRFLINARGVATIAPQASSNIYGLIWRISEADEKALDGYEGVPRYYTKRTVSVRTDDGTVQKALTYVAIDNSPGVPRQDYMEKILAAAAKRDLPSQYVDELRSWLDRGMRL